MTLDGSCQGDDGRSRRDGQRTTPAAANPQVIARGPVAAIVAVKQFGTNGGGFFGANSRASVRESQRLDQSS